MAGFVMTSIGKVLDKAITEMERPMARAATAAMREAAKVAKAKGRESIAAAGFSRAWQNTLKANAYPEGQDSLSPAAQIKHIIDYSEVFEEGATISGSPILWVPLPSVPLGGRFNRPLKPSEYIVRFGPLVSVNHPGRAPLLYPKYKRIGQRRGKAAKAARVPLYIGLDVVTIRKRFDVRKACEEAAQTLPTLYAKNLKGII